MKNQSSIDFIAEEQSAFLVIEAGSAATFSRLLARHCDNDYPYVFDGNYIHNVQFHPVTKEKLETFSAVVRRAKLLHAKPEDGILCSEAGDFIMIVREFVDILNDGDDIDACIDSINAAGNTVTVRLSSANRFDYSLQ